MSNRIAGLGAVALVLFLCATLAHSESTSYIDPTYGGTETTWDFPTDWADVTFDIDDVTPPGFAEAGAKCDGGNPLVQSDQDVSASFALPSVPEPCTMLLLGTGFMGLICRVRRRA